MSSLSDSFGLSPIIFWKFVGINWTLDKNLTNHIMESSTETYTTMSAAMIKMTKAMNVFAEETALSAIDDFLAAFKAEFELDEDDLKAFVDKYKENMRQQYKDAAKEAGKKPKKAQKLDADGNVVKREPSAYNKFVKAKMEELKATNPDIKGKELLAMAAAEWKKQKASDSE